MSRTVHSLTVPSETRYLDRVRAFVERHARRAQLPADTVEQLRVAVDEACTNVIKHAYRGDASQQIDLAVIVEPHRFAVRIRDEGAPFRPDAYAEPDVKALIERRRRGGLGVYLMRQLMDDVEYRTVGSTNEVQLIKYRDAAARRRAAS